MFAIKSLLFPFKVGIIVPHLFDDGEEDENNTLFDVCHIVPYFQGIWSQNLDQCTEFISDNPTRAPLLV
jgi:hypothetical protein